MDVQTHLICTPHSELRAMLTIQCVTSDEGMESGAGWGSGALKDKLMKQVN